MVLDLLIHFQQRAVKSFINSGSNFSRNPDHVPLPMQPKHRALVLTLRYQLRWGQGRAVFITVLMA